MFKLGKILMKIPTCFVASDFGLSMVLVIHCCPCAEYVFASRADPITCGRRFDAGLELTWLAAWLAGR